MKVVDFHTHIFPDKIAEKTVAHLQAVGKTQAYTNGTASGLLASMEDADVDCSVVLPVVTSVTQFDSIKVRGYHQSDIRCSR